MVSIFSSSANGAPWMIRTDFSDQRAWGEAGAAAAADPAEPDQPSAADSFELVDDPQFDGLTPDALLGLDPYPYDTYLLVDHLTVTHPERPILAVDVNDEPGRSFRLVPSQVRDFAANMLISNMDFADFADGVGSDGIFRGFGPLPQAKAPDATAQAAAPMPAKEPENQGSAPWVATGDPDDPTIAPTIKLAFGQRWPGDPNWVPRRAQDIPPMVWDQE